MIVRTTLVISLFLFLLVDSTGQTTYTVNSTDDVDDGNCDAIHCSLREAINEANTDLSASIIEFGIGTGMQETINLDDALPILEEDSTIIDGTTQTGLPGGVRIDCGNIGAQQQDIIRIHGSYAEIYGLEIFNYTVSETPMVEGRGSLIGIGGIFVLASPTTIKIGAPNKGNILHSTFRTRSTAANYANGIAVHSGTEIIIQGNRIGTNYDADQVLELYGEGIRIDENNFGETRIGGPGLDEGNIIGASSNGIGIYGGDGSIKGNHIGVDRSLNVDLGNRENGIFVRDGAFYDIGDSNPAEGNYIYNNNHGILIISNSTQYVGANQIGFNADVGILTTSCPDCLFEFNKIFGNTTGLSMDDSGMTRVRVRFNEFYDNIVGSRYAYQDNSMDMPITQNSHYCNGDGILVNPKQTDAFPTPVSFNSVSTTQVVGLAMPGASIEIFQHDTTDCPNAPCQGKFYLGTTLADGTGLWTYNDVFAPGEQYAVTQTISRNLTSGFSCFQVPDCSTIVTTPADVGAGSLREAILCANANPGADTITFDIMGGIPRTITIQSPLPALTDDSTVIDATTQPGNFPMAKQISLDCGQLAGLGTTGFRVEGDHCEIYGMVIINSEGNGVIAGRDIDPINHFVLGGPDRYNVITENALFGAQVFAGINIRIQSNYFGSDESFNPPFVTANTGLVINVADTASQILVGGDRNAQEGNFFSFGEEAGCEVIGNGTGGSISIFGNTFGTDPMGTTNASNGIAMSGKGALTLANVNSQVGDGQGSHQNIFAYNAEAGLYGILGDHLISNNSFYCNAGGGIDMKSNAQMGNSQVSPPMITNANNTLINGQAQGIGLVEVYFHDDQICPNVPCQGRYFLGSAVPDPATGEWSLTGPFTPALNIGDFVTATYSNADQTSEFSECVQVCPDLLITVDNEGPYCEGDDVQLTSTVNSNSQFIDYSWMGPNGYTSDMQNPSGMLDSGLYVLVLTVDGCEYAPKTTRVVFTASDTTNLDTTLCRGGFIDIGGEIFDENRTSGQVTLPSSSGCDSVINVTIQFEEESTQTIRDTLCFEDFVIINNVEYNRNNPDGRDTIDRGGCDSIIIVDLFFRSELREDINRDLCFGDTLIVNGTIYDENNPSGTDTLTSASGCDSIISVSLTFGDARVERIDTSICEGGFININGTIYDAQNPTGSDTIPMGSTNGCDSVIQVAVTLLPPAIFTLDTVLCPKGSITVNNIVYDQFYMEGTDTIFGGSAGGCDSILNIRIRYPDPVFSIDTVYPNCDGSQAGQFIITDISGIPAPFSYSLNGSPFQDIMQFPWVINNLDEGVYDIIFMDGKNCRHIVQLDLPSTGDIDFEVQSPIQLTLGDSTTLTIESDFEPDSVVWTDEDGNVICNDCESVVVAPGETTSYRVIVFHDGCSSTKTIVVEVDGTITFYVPNVFSPDGDGINDFFNVYSGIPGVMIEQLSIYDRWGELIYAEGGFDASDYRVGWDGTFNGELVENGVYVYHFQVRVPSGRTENLKGSVTIIR